MQSTKVTVSFPATVMTNEAGFSFLDSPIEGVTCYATTAEKARKKLRPILEKKIREALEAESNWQRTMIGTKGGEILLVEFKHGSWGYSIWGPGRKGHGGCSGGNSEKLSLEMARRHAEQSYGGIAWECR